MASDGLPQALSCPVIAYPCPPSQGRQTGFAVGSVSLSSRDDARILANLPLSRHYPARLGFRIRSASVLHLGIPLSPRVNSHLAFSPLMEGLWKKASVRRVVRVSPSLAHGTGKRNIPESPSRSLAPDAAINPV